MPDTAAWTPGEGPTDAARDRTNLAAGVAAGLCRPGVSAGGCNSFRWRTRSKWADDGKLLRRQPFQGPPQTTLTRVRWLASPGQPLDRADLTSQDPVS